MERYTILKIDSQAIYLNREDSIKKVSRDLVDFEIELGDAVDYLCDGDLILILPVKKDKPLELGDGDSVKSSLLQGILSLFLETLAIHNNDLGHLKKIFSQFLVTLFMAWSLLGVILIEILLFVESLIVFVWRGLCLFFRRLNLWNNGKKYLAYRQKRQKEKAKEELGSLDMSSLSSTEEMVSDSDSQSSSLSISPENDKK